MQRGKPVGAAGKLSGGNEGNPGNLLPRADGAARKKLIAVASAFYTPEPTAADLAPYGLSPDDYDDQYIDVWPDVWPSFLVFQAVSTQWRTGMGGASGLDYNVLPWVMSLHHVEDEATALSDIRIMESAALKVMHKERSE
ncbi:DUF1799 domain-containing protein [Enterobacter bugandensis]|uniref:DUF1799 domain-containing protein n=1 Tax=Enterobacter bugandensis TaxID=881260 RepID=UPI0028F6D6C4|nr:DUF1799 domain-containing protein [Enterobacter bugandensis]